MTDQRIFGTVAAADFVGRAAQLDRIGNHAASESPAGLALLATPRSGSSELMRQSYDRLFHADGDAIPFYFAIRSADQGPREIAQRFLLDLLTQTVAFRRNDAAVIDASPELNELSELAVSADGQWIDRLVEAGNAGDGDVDDRAFIRTLLSAPLRAAAHGARIFVMIDDLENCALIPGGDAFFSDLKEIYGRSEVSYIFAGARRFLFGALSAESLKVEPLGFSEAGELTASLGERFDVALNEQTRDLIAEQLGGYPSQMTSLFAAAADRGENFENFRSVESVYTDEIFGGRIGRSVGKLLEQIVPDTSRAEATRMLGTTLDADGGKTTLAYWRKHLGLAGLEFRKALGLLNIFELISVNSGTVFAEIGNLVLSDCLNARARLENAETSRALVVGEAMTDNLKRAPKLLARLYRRNSAIGLRSLLGAFDCQEIAEAAIDYGKFKADLKGLGDAEIESAFASATDKIALPQIVYTAQTAAFYPKIGELIEDERSTIALGFEEMSYRDKTVWIAAEIDSKLEAEADITEFWCDRLQMVAITSGFADYKLWLVAPEGFSDDALEILGDRGAFGSSRKQAVMLMRALTGTEVAELATLADEYEIVVPMGDDTEMIAAHAVEDIARRHSFESKTINQIKTALVEACINATEHSLSPDRRIYQKFVVDDEKITITVANRGLRLLDKTVREIVPDEGRRGWGLKLMKGLMDEVRIEQSDDGTRVTMVKFISHAKHGSVTA